MNPAGIAFAEIRIHYNYRAKDLEGRRAMRILMLHNRYQVRGGEDESADFEAALLRRHGHEVDLMLFENAEIRRQCLLGVGLGAVWSRAAYDRVKRRLSEKAYDLVHIQNFFPLLSPAAHYAGKAARKPVVQGLRNYRLICLNSLLFRAGRPCEDCLHHRIPWPGVVHGCYRGSRRGSLAVAMMLSVHRLLGTWTRRVDCFYTLSAFARDKLIAGGVSREKLLVKPNLIFPDPGEGGGPRKGVFTAGRLVAEKGIGTLLGAWQAMPEPIPLAVAGEGPLASAIEDASTRMPWMQYLGRIDQAEVCERMGRARVVVFPTEVYEVFGRTIVEAFAKGTPVIASDRGASRELVGDHRTGLLFEPGNPADLAEKVRWAWAHPREMGEMGRRARKEYEEKFSLRINHIKLMEIYNRAIENNRLSSRTAPRA